MNFLNRRMFQAGGSTNPYFYINAEGNKEFLSADGLRNDLQTMDSTTLVALIQNPDVTYSPATQEIFRQVFAERQPNIGSNDPLTFEFGTTPDKPSEASILPAVRTLLANPLVLAPIYPSYIGKYLTVISAPLVGAVANVNVVPDIE